MSLSCLDTLRFFFFWKIGSSNQLQSILLARETQLSHRLCHDDILMTSEILCNTQLACSTPHKLKHFHTCTLVSFDESNWMSSFLKPGILPGSNAAFSSTKLLRKFFTSSSMATVSAVCGRLLLLL